MGSFIDRNPESPYVRNSYRAVVRYWMTKSQILAKYGKEISKEDLKALKDKWYDSDGAATYGRAYGRAYGDTIVAHEENTEDPIPGYPDNEYSSRRYQLIPVYDVEWLETDDDFVM